MKIGVRAVANLVALNYFVGYLTFRRKKLEAILEGRPQIVVHNGKVLEEVMAEAQLTHHELNAALRRAGYGSVEEVHAALLETNGTISILPKKGPFTGV